MDWDDLRVFAELARTGSLSAAARTLKMDHTTVGRRIAALEDSLGVRLFDRLPRGTLLTADGERIAEAALRMEEQAFTISRLAQEGTGLTGRVRVSAPPNLSASFIAPRLGPLRKAHPGIHLELIGENRSVSLARREADIAVRLARPQGDSLVGRKLGTLAYRLYGTKTYVEQHREAEDWDWIGFDEEMEHLPQQRWVRQMAGDRDFVFRSNEQSIQLAAVKAGVGIAALPCHLGEPEPDLVRVPGQGVPAPRELWLVVHQDLRRSPRIRAVMDFLADIVTKDIHLLEGHL